MALNTKIKAVLAKIGSAFQVLQPDNTWVSGEYVDYDLSFQVTKPFIRENFLDATMPYDTIAESGDIIKLNAPSDVYIIAHKTPTQFKNTIVENAVVLFKCNVSGQIIRQEGMTWDSNYKKVPLWVNVKTNAYANLTEDVLEDKIIETAPIGDIELGGLQMYVPTSFGIREQDRYVLNSGAANELHYKVTNVMKYRFNGVRYCTLSEDTR